MEGRCCALPAIARFSPRLKAPKRYYTVDGHTVQYSQSVFEFALATTLPGKEADEVTRAANGRWFSFAITGANYLIIEKNHSLNTSKHCQTPKSQ